jgi:hypothetical protein
MPYYCRPVPCPPVAQHWVKTTATYSRKRTLAAVGESKHCRRGCSLSEQTLRFTLATGTVVLKLTPSRSVITVCLIRQQFLNGDRWIMPDEEDRRPVPVEVPLEKRPKYVVLLPQIAAMADAGSGRRPHLAGARNERRGRPRRPPSPSHRRAPSKANRPSSTAAAPAQRHLDADLPPTFGGGRPAPEGRRKLRPPRPRDERQPRNDRSGLRLREPRQSPRGSQVRAEADTTGLAERSVIRMTTPEDLHAIQRTPGEPQKVEPSVGDGLSNNDELPT